MRAPKRSNILLLGVACLTPVPGALRAQTDSMAAVHAAWPDSERVVQRRTCFRAQPLAACRAWIPFTIAIVVRLGSTSPAVDSPFGYAPGNELDFRQFGAIDIGYMVNRDSSHAIGGMIEAGSLGFDKRVALKAQRQQWLSRSWSASAGLGVVRAQQQSVARNRTTQAYGATVNPIVAPASHCNESPAG